MFVATMHYSIVGLKIALILLFCFNNNFIIAFLAGYACRLLTPEMKLLICGEESLDVSNSRCQLKKQNKFESELCRERQCSRIGKEICK